MSGAAAAAVLLLGAAGPSAALVKGFEPMAALKGKDYGKERQRCWPVPGDVFIIAHKQGFPNPRLHVRIPDPKKPCTPGSMQRMCFCCAASPARCS